MHYLYEANAPSRDLMYTTNHLWAALMAPTTINLIKAYLPNGGKDIPHSFIIHEIENDLAKFNNKPTYSLDQRRMFEFAQQRAPVIAQKVTERASLATLRRGIDERNEHNADVPKTWHDKAVLSCETRGTLRGYQTSSRGRRIMDEPHRRTRTGCVDHHKNSLGNRMVPKYYEMC
jgi:hypothetical protein